MEDENGIQLYELSLEMLKANSCHQAPTVDGGSVRYIDSRGCAASIAVRP